MTGSWFFAPDEGDEWYVRDAADAQYMAETLYARFGHWLTTTGIDGDTEVNTYAMTPSAATVLDLAVSDTDDT